MWTWLAGTGALIISTGCERSFHLDLFLVPPPRPDRGIVRPPLRAHMIAGKFLKTVNDDVGYSSREIFSCRSWRSCASTVIVAIGRASSLASEIGSPVTSQ
jgi:hypothetical protein